MTEHTPSDLWHQLAALVAAAQADEVRAFLSALPPGEAARLLSRLDDEAMERLLVLIGPEAAATLIAPLSDALAADIIEDLPAAEAAAIVDELPSNEQADLLGAMDTADAAAILEQMEPADARDARELLQYPPDSTGGIMTTEYLVYREDTTKEAVVHDLAAFSHQYAGYDIQYLFITNARGELIGVIPIRNLLLAKPRELVGSFMIADPAHVTVDTTLEELQQFFDQHPFVGAPVIDDEGRLAGVVSRAGVAEAVGERATEVFLAVSGIIGEEELRSMPVGRRAARRLSWLSVNIVLNIIAASVIAFYQDTLMAVIALAVFLPIISDMSGCSGNQAVAVSIRELTLGLVKPHEFLHVIWKEGLVAILNGLALGLLLGGVAFLWQGNLFLGLVVGGALMLNTIIAVVLGGLLPLALKRFNQDPAVASGPILTTVTDLCGFLLVLSLASKMVSRLAG